MVTQIYAPPMLLTGADFAALEQQGPAELIEGEFVPMTPPGYDHCECELNFASAIRAFARQHGLGKTFCGEVGIYTRRNPDTIRAADAAFISFERFNQRTEPTYLDVAPELVVEILSPNDRWREVLTKLEEYLTIGVKVVWLVDPAKQQVLAYQSLTQKQTFHAEDLLTCEAVLPGFAIKVAELF